MSRQLLLRQTTHFSPKSPPLSKCGFHKDGRLSEFRKIEPISSFATNNDRTVTFVKICKLSATNTGADQMGFKPDAKQTQSLKTPKVNEKSQPDSPSGSRYDDSVGVLFKIAVREHGL